MAQLASLNVCNVDMIQPLLHIVSAFVPLIKSTKHLKFLLSTFVVLLKEITKLIVQCFI